MLARPSDRDQWIVKRTLDAAAELVENRAECIRNGSPQLGAVDELELAANAIRRLAARLSADFVEQAEAPRVVAQTWWRRLIRAGE